MSWLIIIGVLLLAFGPLMYLLPTKADKRLSELRLAARRAGLGVKLTHLPKLDATASERVSAGGQQKTPRISCVAYELATGLNIHGLAPILLLRLPLEPTVRVSEVLPGWALDRQCDLNGWRRFIEDGRTASVLETMLTSLPPDTLGCGINERAVACYWREKSDSSEQIVAQIRDALGSVRAELERRFAGAATADDPDP